MEKDNSIILTNYSLVMSKKPKPSDENRDKELVQMARNIIKENNLPKGYICVIEATHTGVPTLKYLAYSSKGMDEAVKTFYTPSWKPIKLNHKTSSPSSPLFDPNDVPLGRVLFAEFRKGKKETPHGVADGTVVVVAYIPETAKLPNGENVIDAIIDRRFMNVSMSALFSRETAKCSICGKNPLVGGSDGKGVCSHERGNVYDGKLCYYILSDPEFEELSFVTTPADEGAYIAAVAVSDSVHSEFDCVDPYIGSIGVYMNDGNVYVRDSKAQESVMTDAENRLPDHRSRTNISNGIVMDSASVTRLIETVASLAEAVLELSAQSRGEREEDSSDNAQQDQQVSDGNTDTESEASRSEGQSNSDSMTPDGSEPETDSGGGVSDSNTQKNDGQSETSSETQADAVDTHGTDRSVNNTSVPSTGDSTKQSDVHADVKDATGVDIRAYINSRRPRPKGTTSKVPFKINR